MKAENTFKWGTSKAGAVWGGITGTLANQLDLKNELDTIKGNVMTNTAGLALVNRALADNVEYDSGQTFGGKTIYMKLVSQGNLKSNTDIPATGDLVSNVDLFLGVEYGVISRKSTQQLHNISAINNSPDQHSSIIYQDGGSNIKWYYASTMTLTSFQNRPFKALIKYTKTI